MASQLRHEDIQSLLGVYALDALEPDEAAIVDAHLVDCPRCRAEVAEHREAASLLSFSGAEAPGGVWTRIAASLGDGPPPFELRAPTPIRRRRPNPMILAAAAAAVVVALLSAQVVKQGNRIDALSSVVDQRGLDQAAAAAALDPAATTVTLRSDDGAQVVRAVVLPDGQGYLVHAELPRLGADRTYQLWGVMGAQTVSLGVLGAGTAIVPFVASGPLSALAITAERAGGAVAPTSTPIVQGTVDA